MPCTENLTNSYHDDRRPLEYGKCGMDPLLCGGMDPLLFGLSLFAEDGGVIPSFASGVEATPFSFGKILFLSKYHLF